MRVNRLQRNVLSRYVLAAALSCSAFSSLSALPEAPSIDRSVTEIQGLGTGNNDPATMTRSYIPVNHTTGDGRVAVDIKPFQGGADGNGGTGRVEFYLYVPEKLNTPFLDATPGPADIMWTGRVDIPMGTFVSEIEEAEDNSIGDIRHVTIIDKTREFDPDGTSQSNPRNVGGEDVYDLLIFATVDWRNVNGSSRNGYLKMQTTPITVYVSNPKTASAAIRDIVVDPTGNGIDSSSDYIHIARLFENKFTNDGKLMVARVGVFTPTDPLYYRPDNGVQTNTNFMDTVYAYSSDGSLDGKDGDPIDGFDNIIPISWAPYDPRINGSRNGPDDTFYPFAAFPFRDGSGTPIPPGKDFGGSYPWIDSDGRTLSMSTVAATLNEGNPYPRYTNERFDTSVPESLNEDSGPFQNQSIVGLWTQGKLVAMDNSLNNTDYGIGKGVDEHRMVTLYEPANADTSSLPITDGVIRVGSGRENSNVQMHGGAGNTTFFDTIENRFSYNENLRTVMPRDVVWWVSNGKSTAQFAFDDYLNKDGFIVSKMNGALEFDDFDSGSRRFFYYDGWLDGVGWTDGNGDPAEDVRVANDACALPARWDIPDNGLVTGSDIRLEPIAHGGIEGKGMWLDADASITYAVPAQPSDVALSSWYVGIFVDSRFDNDTTERRLITFPDNSSISIVGRDEIRYRRPNGIIAETFAMPDAGTWNRNEWRHLAFQIYAGGDTVEFYHNGFLADVRALPEEMFQMDQGNLIVGATSGSNGVRGWIDDFKVFAQMFGPEVCANLARGTLVAIDPSAPGDAAYLVDRANLYNGSGEGNIRDILYHSGQEPVGATNRYAVHYDYTEHDGAHLGNIPTGATSIRENIVFPEAPLFNDTHRPDSSQNMFCSSCHDNTNPAPGLQEVALDLQNGILATEDPRRQPVQSLRRVFGNIPANWLGANAPASAFVTSSDGALIDEMELASQNAGSRVVRSLSLTDSSGGVEERIEAGPIFYIAGDLIRANLDAAQGSVRFQILNTGTSTVVRTLNANEAPYAVAVPTDLLGTYDIMATPFSNNNGGGTEGVSYTVIGVTFDDDVGGATLPAAPSGLAAPPPTGTSVSLSWTDNSNNEDGFRIQRRVTGGTFSTLIDLGPGATFHTDNSVAASTGYDYRVRAFNAAGESGNSNTISVTIPAGGSVPTIPGTLEVTSFTSSSISLSWVDNSGNEDGFRIARSVEGGAYAFLEDVPAGETSYTDPGLAPSTSYSYRVAAFNAFGVSIYSNFVNQTTQSGGLAEILSDDFEGGIGPDWNDGGSDCLHYTGTNHSPAGSGSMRLRDDTSTSVMTTDNLSLASATQLQVAFSYKAVNLNGAEDFWLQVSTDGGATYVTVEEWNLGDEFNNNDVNSDSVTITNAILGSLGIGNFSSQTRIRFRCDASANNDSIYLDDIIVSADI